MILEQGKNRYFIVLLRNQNVIPEIDPLTDLYGQVKFEKDIVDYIQQGRKVAVLEIEIDHMNDINILYGTNYSDRIQKVLAYRFIYMMDADKAVYRMGNSNYAFILRDASREEVCSCLDEVFFDVLREGSADMSLQDFRQCHRHTGCETEKSFTPSPD